MKNEIAIGVYSEVKHLLSDFVSKIGSIVDKKQDGEPQQNTKVIDANKIGKLFANEFKARQENFSNKKDGVL